MKYSAASVSNRLLDEIDRPLAAHSGFTAEALHLLFKYDVNHRLGQASENGEDE